MANLLPFLYLFPLLPAYAVTQAPPGIAISNGEVEPVGTVTACSTITTIIGTLINVIPVPCASDGAALPSVFTEVVVVGGTTASLVIGPTDIHFISEPWLQPTATPSASGLHTYSHSPSVRGSSSPESVSSASTSSRTPVSGSLPTDGISGSASLVTTSSSPGITSITGSGLASGSGVPRSASINASSSLPGSGFVTGSGVSPRPSSTLDSSSSGSLSITGGTPSVSASAVSMSASSGLLSSHSASVNGGSSISGSGISVGASISSNGSISSNSLSIASSVIGDGDSTTNSLGATGPVSGSPTSGSSAVSNGPSSSAGSSSSMSDCIPRPRAASGASGSLSSTPGSGSIEYCPETSSASTSGSVDNPAPSSGSISLSLGPESVSQTASPASTTSGLASSTPASITQISSEASKTALFVPVTSPATTIAAVGVVAGSSAKAVQTSVSIIIPLIQSYIRDPGCASCSTEAIKALKGVLPIVEGLFNEIGPGPSSKNCDASINLLQDIFNAVKCTAQNVEKAIESIEGGKDEIEELTKTVTSLTDLQKPLENDSEDKDNKSQESQKNQSSENSQSGTSASPRSSSQLSSQSSSVASSSVSSSASSSGSCLLPPEITLPPDSLTGIAQPDQPTSVVVTGLPSVDGSSSALSSGSAITSGSHSASPFSSSSLPSVTGSMSTAGSLTALSSARASPISVSSAQASSTPTDWTQASSDPLSSTLPASVTSAPAKSTIAPNYCMTDGAPWYSPSSWCDCGPSSKYPLRTAGGASTGDCSYTSLPDSTIQPVSTSAAPTNIPGQGGLPGCAYVLYPDGQGCPFANYCNCGGTYVDLLTTTISGTSTMNCDYTVQPTANSCPAPTTTPATSTPPPTSSTPPPLPSANVAIIAYREDSCGDIYSGCSSDGRVYDISPGEVVPVCGTAKAAATWDYTEDVQNETRDYNIQTPKFTSHNSYKNCQYKGTAHNVGSFNCDGFPTSVQCITPVIQATSCSNSHSLDQDDFTPIFYCEWYSPPQKKRSENYMNRFRRVER